jgi:protein ImuA
MTALSELRAMVRQIEQPAAARHGVLPFGLAAIDRTLPGGGLALGALHEILGQGGDEEDGALAAAFAAHILGRLAAAKDGIVLWCLARPDLYGPGLAECGLDPARLVLAQAARDADLLWAMEEGLRGAGVAAVVGEAAILPAVASRRLQLAAEHSGVTALLLRRWRDGGTAARERVQPNAAVTRWRLASLPSRPMPILPPLSASARWEWERAEEPGVGNRRWRVELLRCRGGGAGCWVVEAADATGALSLADAMADRPAATIEPAREFRRAG